MAEPCQRTYLHLNGAGLGLGLGLVAGAMIFVLSHELIPESHRNGHQTPVMIRLMAGFAVMMIPDTAIA